MDGVFLPMTTNELLEALDRDNPAHGVVMNAQGGEYRYNWLDAAPAPWLVENAGSIILALACRMVIRLVAMHEMEFSRNGYTADGPVARGIISEHILKESEQHQAFYLKTKERLAKLARLDSINRRSFEVVRFSEAKAPTVKPDPSWAEGKVIVEEDRNLFQIYELLRRSNITEYAPIVHGPGRGTNTWLDEATPEELEGTDTIMLAAGARMAIRASLRLEKAWRQHPWINNNGLLNKTDLRQDLRQERDRSVDSYLKTREALARREHNQGIVARSAGMAMQKPRRPHAKRKKVNSA
jgi:hypothetical protein